MLIKLGKTYIETDNITSVVVGETWNSGIVYVTTTAISGTWETEATHAVDSQTIKFEDDEAAALIWWLERKSHDVMRLWRERESKK